MAKSVRGGVRQASKKSIKNSIKSYDERIKEHEKKIRDTENSDLPDSVKQQRIHHWQKEIDVFKKNRAKKIRKLADKGEINYVNP